MGRLLAFLTGLWGVYQRAGLFISRDVWRVDLAATVRWGALWVYPLRIVLIVIRGFLLEHHCLLRASALTYNTLLSLVPMLAFMLAFLKGFGAQNLLEPLLVAVLSTGSEDMVRAILGYASNIEVRALGGIGLATLLLTTVLQVGNVEGALNEIWGVQTERPVLRKIADYASVLVLGPVALLLATSINTRLHSLTFIPDWLAMQVIGNAVTLLSTMLSTVLPYVALWLVFTFFYAFLPNTRVQPLPALLGGVVGGTLWQVSQWVYIQLQVGMANAQAIYGALAQLPVLMLWIYVSWVTALLGAEVAFACQHAMTYVPARLVPRVSTYVKEWLAHALYCSLARAFLEGTGPWSARDFALQHRVPLRLLETILAPLCAAGLIVEMAPRPEHYVPGRDPSGVTPWHVFQALRHYDDEALAGMITLNDALTMQLMTQVEDAQQQVASRYNMPQWLAGKDAARAASDERNLS